MPDRSLRILMTDPHLEGGGQVTYVSRLAGALTRLGHAITIGCKPSSILLARAAEAHCGVHNGFVFKGGLRPGAWVRDLRAMRRYITVEKPDLIHVSGSQDHWVCALGNRLLGRPVCLLRTRHNTYPVKDSLPNRILNRAWTDYQIVVCDVVRRTLAQQPAFDGERMCTIHNGVDAEQFKPDAAARRRARHEFGYTEAHVVCGIAARLVPAKGHEFLFRATAQLASDYPVLRVLVLGQGDLEARLKRMAEECGIADRVQFAGFRNDMAYCTQAFDIGVQPSIDCDTSSFSLKEQMAAEKPVIASDYGGLTEIVDDGVQGLVVPAGAAEPLARAVQHLLEDPQTALRMGRNGRQRVLREFSVDVFAQRTVQAYHRALASHRERREHRN